MDLRWIEEYHLVCKAHKHIKMNKSFGVYFENSTHIWWKNW